MAAKLRLAPTIFAAVSFLMTVGLCSAAHITDKLVVGVYEQAAATGTPLRLIASGTPLDVIRRNDGFSKVRLADGTEGFVESDYITEEKPAKAILLETQAKLRQQGIELAGLREKLGGQDNAAVTTPAERPPSAPEAKLRQSLGNAEARIAELEAELGDRPQDPRVVAQRDELRERANKALQLLAGAPGVQLHAAAEQEEQGLLKGYGAWIFALLALGLGFVAGMKYVDYRIRKRYGGFRI